MDFIKPMCFLAFWAILLHMSMGQMSKTTKNQITTGLKEFKGVVDAWEKVTSNQKLVSNIQKLSPYLGVVGGLVSFALVFLPAQDSPELAYMKKEFSEVNMKLDRITQKLNSVKDIITLENQRAAYVKDASKILFAYKKLTQNYIPQMAAITSCSSTRDCLRQRLRVSESYKKTFDVKSSLYTVLTGTMHSTSVFGDPLLDLIKKTHECDINKVIDFADGVIKLAFKGQQVVLAHEKLTGTKMSISQSMKDWSKMVYGLRQKTDNIKTSCYNNIDRYITADVRQKKYQLDFSSNRDAANKMKADLEKKYPWIYWKVIAYGAYGGRKHWGFSSFYNIPKNKNDRKRVLRVMAQDKGTYMTQRQELSSTLEKIFKVQTFPASALGNAHKVYDILAKELKKTTVWKKLNAFIVLKSFSDLQVAVDNQHGLYYYNEEHTLCFKDRRNVRICNRKVRIWASLKSKEEIAGRSCTRTCSGKAKGRCVLLPRSTSSVCVCKPYHEGDNCQSYDKINLATSVDSMLTITAQIPKITDVFFELLDMKDFIGASLGRLHDSIAALDAKLQKQFENINHKITHEFRWANLITRYSGRLSDLKHYLHLFQNLKSSNVNYETKKIKFAKAVLHHERIPRWVLDLNYLIVGRSDGLILNHKPLLFIMMEMHKRAACSVRYKNALDNSWRQLIILQNQAYLMWAQAKSIMNQPSDDVMTLYKNRVAQQKTFMASSTCQLSIPKSTNLKCTGGYYILPTLVLKIQCERNYYIHGTSSTSCKTKSSKCLACSCNSEGSSNAECSDGTGKCSCKNNFYGNKCSNRDCKWTSFGRYGSCTRSCGYGGQKTRSRTHAVTQKGNGRHCAGSSRDSTSCFLGCCPSKYHCTANRKCIPGTWRCDYDNDCGNSQDEASCSESCHYKYTTWNSHGRGNAVYMDRHRINCGGSGNVIQYVKMQRSGSQIRFEYKCCKLLKNVCSLRKVTNAFTYDGNGDTVYLDRQTVSCGSYGVLNDFWLSRSSNHKYWRYNYYCCDMYRPRLSCYRSSTSFTYDGNGKNYYLDRQSISCDSRYFLQYFRLNRNRSHDKWRYSYRCCRITT